MLQCEMWRWSMEDAIGILTLGAEFVGITLLNQMLHGPATPLWLLTSVFIFVAIIGLVVWHTQKSPEDVVNWRMMIIYSIVVGGVFFGIDFIGGLFFRS